MEKINVNGVLISGEKIKANVWGGQEDVILTTWKEIKKLGFELRERAFGTLNDRRSALYFGRWNKEKGKHDWYLTTETLEELIQLEK